MVENNILGRKRVSHSRCKQHTFLLRGGIQWTGLTQTCLQQKSAVKKWIGDFHKKKAEGQFRSTLQSVLAASLAGVNQNKARPDRGKLTTLLHTPTASPSMVQRW